MPKHRRDPRFRMWFLLYEYLNVTKPFASHHPVTSAAPQKENQPHQAHPNHPKPAYSSIHDTHTDPHTPTRFRPVHVFSEPKLRESNAAPSIFSTEENPRGNGFRNGSNTPNASALHLVIGATSEVSGIKPRRAEDPESGETARPMDRGVRVGFPRCRWTRPKLCRGLRSATWKTLTWQWCWV